MGVLKTFSRVSYLVYKETKSSGKKEQKKSNNRKIDEKNVCSKCKFRFQEGMLFCPMCGKITLKEFVENDIQIF